MFYCSLMSRIFNYVLKYRMTQIFGLLHYISIDKIYKHIVHLMSIQEKKKSLIGRRINICPSTSNFELPHIIHPNFAK